MLFMYSCPHWDSRWWNHHELCSRWTNQSPWNINKHSDIPQNARLCNPLGPLELVEQNTSRIWPSQSDKKSERTRGMKSTVSSRSESTISALGDHSLSLSMRCCSLTFLILSMQGDKFKSWSTDHFFKQSVRWCILVTGFFLTVLFCDLWHSETTIHPIKIKIKYYIVSIHYIK